MKFGQLILRKIVAARPVGSTPGGWNIYTPKVPTTGSWSNPETVGDLMGEVRARCIESLSVTTSSMEGGTLQRQQTTVMKEKKRRQFNMQLRIAYKAITENSRNYSVCKSSSFTHTISA